MFLHLFLRRIGLHCHVYFNRYDVYLRPATQGLNVWWIPRDGHCSLLRKAHAALKTSQTSCSWGNSKKSFSPCWGQFWRDMEKFLWAPPASLKGFARTLCSARGALEGMLDTLHVWKRQTGPDPWQGQISRASRISRKQGWLTAAENLPSTACEIKDYLINPQSFLAMLGNKWQSLLVHLSVLLLTAEQMFGLRETQVTRVTYLIVSAFGSWYFRGFLRQKLKSDHGAKLSCWNSPWVWRNPLWTQS